MAEFSDLTQKDIGYSFMIISNKPLSNGKRFYLYLEYNGDKKGVNDEFFKEFKIPQKTDFDTFTYCYNVNNKEYTLLKLDFPKDISDLITKYV
uniref:Uncharacterized protein n=1 Tax=viral metagenome TaxID=1070528 RepID=A0A6C0EQK9_9ZZZZ